MLKYILIQTVLMILLMSFSQSFAAVSAVPEILDGEALKDGVGGHALVDPCQDFYQFACGNWIDQTAIPDNKKSVYRQTTYVSDQTDVGLNKILQAYANGNYTLPSAQAQQLGAFYKSCLMVETTKKTSLDFVRSQIAILQAIPSIDQLPKVVAQAQLVGFAPFFNFASRQDPADSNQVIGNLSQGGQSLPDRDYYLNTDAEAKKILQQYTTYIRKLFHLFGFKQSEALKASKIVLSMETAMAKASLSIADSYDAEKTTHLIGLESIRVAVPAFNWDQYFSSLNLQSSQLNRFNLEEPDFFAHFQLLLTASSLEDIKIYLIWKLLDRSAEKMGGDFEKLHFQFWMTDLNGAKQILPRWKLCTQAVENNLGYALAEAYVKTFDGDKIKKRTEIMISQIKEAFSTELISLSQNPNQNPEAWLDPSTYQAALEKIQLMAQKVGGPEKWRDYSELEKQGSHFLFNSLYVTQFETKRDLKKIGRPTDKLEWYMMPWEINAYYDPANNEFNFPFGILQPPSMDLGASDGANLGSFGGGTIGHELTHGFDNSGSQYDAHGNIKNWWSAATKVQFDQRAKCFSDQASQYQIKEVNLNVKGVQTLTENLADQGGVKLGYRALTKILESRPEALPWLGRFTERQQYWIAYGQSWCSKTRPESLRVQMTSDPHPPAEFRVNAVMMNRPEFAKDFKCSEGANMAPKNRCSIW